MKYLALRDWEWMIRTAAPEDVDPYEEFADIWQGHSGRGNDNAAAQQWLSDRVRYDRPDTAFPRPHQWSAHPVENLPGEPGTSGYRDLQQEGEESNRTIDGSHAAFEDALRRGLENDYSDPGRYNLGGQGAQPYEPTSSERLASDEGWLLGPNKTFNWPGGRDQYEAIHNGMHQRGFELQNVGSDEDPIPAYVHQETGASIRPGVDEQGEPIWSMRHPGHGTSLHAGPSSAAAMHQENVSNQAAEEARRWQAQYGRDDVRQRARDEYSRDYRPYDPGPSRPIRRREAHDYIPKTKAQGMRWGDLFDEAIHGNEGHGREFERASVKSVLNPYRGDTGRLYGVHREQWDKDHAEDAAGRGKVAQAIYHYQTPIAWKYHSVQPDGTYDEGTWRYPATSFGSGGFFSTGRVQGLMGPSFYRGGRGAPSYSHTRDPIVDYDTHRAFEDASIHRQDDNTYRATDAFGNSHHIAPSQSGRTAVHTVTSPDGASTWTKRLSPLEAGRNTVAMYQLAGTGGPTDPGAFLKSKGYRGSGAAAPAPRAPRREVPLRIQPELPGMPRIQRGSSIAGWSEFLRD